MFNSDPLKTPGIHEKEIKAYFGKDAYFTGDAPVFDQPLYLLAFSNRSGSNLFASYLRSTRYFGGFHEQLIHSTVRTQAAKAGCLSFPELIQFYSTNFGKNFEAWGFKASWDQIMMLFRLRITRMYPEVKIIHILRRNLVEQAVSFSIAEQTKKWTSMQDGEPDVEPVYDYSSLNDLVEKSAQAELLVRTISNVFELPYLSVSYEGLVRNPKQIMKQTSNFAQLNLKNWEPPTPPIEKQATQINKDFYDRYIAERRRALLS